MYALKEYKVNVVEPILKEYKVNVVEQKIVQSNGRWESIIRKEY